jgi:hypothetical protein
MSIVALKKNSRRYIDPISGGNNGGFSLNGRNYNIGHVGPTNLGSYTNKHGAAYNCISNDSTTIKKSVMNTRGMLATKNLCLNNSDGISCREFWVTPMGPEHFSQSEYIRNKMSKNLAMYVDVSNSGINSCCNNVANESVKNWLNSRHIASNYTKDLKVAISHSEYMRGKLMKKHCLPPCRAKDLHFPMYLNNSMNHITVKTKAHAITLGLMSNKDCCTNN